MLKWETREIPGSLNGIGFRLLASPQKLSCKDRMSGTEVVTPHGLICKSLAQPNKDAEIFTSAWMWFSLLQLTTPTLWYRVQGENIFLFACSCTGSARSAEKHQSQRWREIIEKDNYAEIWGKVRGNVLCYSASRCGTNSELNPTPVEGVFQPHFMVLDAGSSLFCIWYVKGGVATSPHHTQSSLNSREKMGFRVISLLYALTPNPK
jgi:hypothetical protein